ncbi:hypothetical protein B0T18DRAFT_2685 [Schizothecium vesticola]|uniref:Secreted protein n=1 Tax=Schizothecium vesticola TaxID=314040 RepID=A0AA40F7Z5_9PEZI|nr:hypothetical protein B0T18DRAFT_2685 [Schizothecium vesticola]
MTRLRHSRSLSIAATCRYFLWILLTSGPVRPGQVRHRRSHSRVINTAPDFLISPPPSRQAGELLSFTILSAESTLC